MPPADVERSLLAEALGVTRATLAPLGREPLGLGAVAGFRGPGDAIHYVDTSRAAVRAETGLVSDRCRIWMHPADPHLPALAPVAFGDAAGILLARLGIAAEGAPELVAYRPGRRAVVRMPTGAGPVWIKVVPPQRAARVHATHAALFTAGIPVPAVLGWAPDGLLVLADAVGGAATDASWEPAKLLDAVDDLRARLAAVPLPHSAGSASAGRLRWYRERAGAVFGDDRAARLAFAIDRVRARAAEPVTAGIHGDLHLGQLFVDAGGTRLTGLVDVDTAGIGDPAEDAAAFVAHAVASAVLTVSGRGHERANALAELARERWLDEPRARAGAAVHLLGHALGAAENGDADRSTRLLHAGNAVLDASGPLLRRG